MVPADLLGSYTYLSRCTVDFGPTLRLLLSRNCKFAWPVSPVRTVSFEYTSEPPERVRVLPEWMPSAWGFTEVAFPMASCPYDAVACRTNKIASGMAIIQLR